MQNSLAKFPKPELQVYLFLDVENILPLLYTVLLLLKFLIETSKFGNPFYFFTGYHICYEPTGLASLSPGTRK